MKKYSRIIKFSVMTEADHKVAHQIYNEGVTGLYGVAFQSFGGYDYQHGATKIEIMINSPTPEQISDVDRRIYEMCDKLVQSGFDVSLNPAVDFVERVMSNLSRGVFGRV